MSDKKEERPTENETAQSGSQSESVPHKEHTRGPSKEELRAGFAKMRKLEWITLFYQISAAVLLGALMGGSQAMKTEWLENLLAIIPVAGVLLTFGTENKEEDKERPFGYHPSGTVA